MAWGQLQEVAKHTLVDQIRLCVRCLWLCTRICVPRTSVTDVLHKHLFQLSNKSFVVHQPTLCALWVRLRHLEKRGQNGYVTPAVSGIPTASERGGGRDQKWPTSGQSGYVTPAVSGIPTASERGAKSEVVPKRGPELLCNPCHLGDPQKGGGRHGPRSAGAKRPLGVEGTPFGTAPHHCGY